MRTRRLAHEEEASLVEHLEELRGRVMLALGAVAVGTAVAFAFHSFVTSVLLGVVCVRRNRRRGYFIVAVAALALPGPDPVTTLLELLSMWALFEGSIWLAALAERRAARLSVMGAQA